MRRLLDTHIAIWAVTGDDRLPPATADVIRDRSIEIYVSAATLWEIAIKNALPVARRNAIPFSAAEAADWFERTELSILPVKAAHTIAVENLPPIHKDPFDRLLVAQAATEPMILLTHDARLAAYGPMVERV